MLYEIYVGISSGNGMHLMAKPLPEPILTYFQLNHQKYLWMKYFIQNSNIFIENAFEIVFCYILAL